MLWIDTPESSNIARYKYIAEETRLVVEFKHGGAYSYFDVPPEIATEMDSAASKGSFLAKKIKPAFRYAKVEL